MDTQRRTRRAAGFTLLELIVVITIIGILGTIVVVNVTGSIGRAKATKIKTDLQKIVQTAGTYYADTGSYPETIDEMRSETDANGVPLSSRFEGEILDPWGNEYGYEVRNGKPMAYCLGKDQAEGGEGEDLDYYYPELSDEGY